MASRKPGAGCTAGVRAPGSGGSSGSAIRFSTPLHARYIVTRIPLRRSPMIPSSRTTDLSQGAPMRTVHRSRSALAAAIAAPVLALMVAAPAQAQGSVGGVVYTQYTLNVSDTLSSLNNFDVTRAYVNVNGQFAGGIRTRVTADVFNTGGAGGAHAFRLKYAYATWTPDGSALTYKMGAVQTPWLDWEEALWDYRMQGQMATERGGYVSSSDFGLGVDGRWSDDMFNFQAGIWNGENYSGTPGDKRKDFMARASYRVMGTDD